MKRQQTITVFFLTVLNIFRVLNLSAQQVNLDFPQMPEKEVKLYYFAGLQVDSVAAQTDKKGKANLKLPETAYRGMAFLKIADAGGIEIVVAGQETAVACKSELINAETIDFSASEENKFLQRIFTDQSHNLQQEAWLKAAKQFYDENSPFLKAVQTELSTVEQAIETLHEEVASSPLYAARYYDLNRFMNRLFEADQQADKAKALAIRQEMETSLDIASLYRTGQLWESVHNYYISLFNRTGGEDKHRQYTLSVLRTLDRLQQPLYDAYLAGSIAETERFGWMDSRDSILAKTLDKKPDFKTLIPSLKQAVEAFQMRSRKIAPGIAGLSPQTGYEKMLVAFHDTDCNTCVNEMNALSENYELLRKNKIRVVSLAADRDAERFASGTSNFPWSDKFCDFKGFEGENFKAFGVMATPTFFLVNKDGIIENEYHSAEDVIKGI